GELVMNIKKTVAILLVVATLTGTISTPVTAAPTSVVEAVAGVTAIAADLNCGPISYRKPISESTYTDKDGTEITEKIYFVPAKPASNISNHTMRFNDVPVMSGEGWYKKEKVHKWKGGAGETKYWVKGYFVWGNGESKLKTPQYGYKNTGKYIKISNESKTKTGNSLKFSFTASNRVSRSQKLSVSLKVNSKGKAS
ncbi:MAG: hypothetical protein K2P60_02600, partial [Lachnospiraceae bacterium]|nr:hypothetical protein [Lachnospiraceae bacterium]